MKEQEYINVRDLSKVMIAKSQIGDIICGGTSICKPEERKMILTILTRWGEELYKVIYDSTSVGK